MLIRTLSFSLLLISFITLPALQLKYANYLTKKTEDKFYQKSPDLIGVFTGDKGRIHRAINVGINNPSSLILISGVYSKNNLEIILNNHFPKELDQKKFDFLSRVTELDFQAQNTRQNVEQTLHFLKEQIQLKEILIISSDYHLPRINFLLWSLNSDKSLKFHLEGQASNSLLHRIFQSYLEFIKIIKEFILFILY